MTDLTTKELLKEYNSIVDVFYKSNTLHSHTDFVESVLELNKREEL